uniref:acyltransferase family protein n=1 Tax=uncultured Dysgonomonas sp. TaxID=206096 RepID=UPI00260D4114|nr:acyltransferase family protein [uncultured Dysgonomonas sp.]
MQRNITLDYLKILLSFFVILIHLRPFFKEGSEFIMFLGWEITNSFTRIAVPCFFILNGYFLSKYMNNWKVVKKYALRILVIYTTWVLIYLSLYASLGYIEMSRVSILPIIKGIVVGFDHLWYLNALIMTVLILFFLYKIHFINGLKGEVILIIALFVIGYFVQCELLMERGGGYVMYSRNALFIGIPFVLLGKIIKTYEEKIVNININVLYLFMFLSGIVLVLESYFAFTSKASLDIYLSLIILSPAVIIYALKHSVFRSNDDNFKGMLATAIYCSHGLILTWVRTFPGHISPFFQLPVILFLTLCISMIVIELNKRVKIFI